MRQKGHKMEIIMTNELTSEELEKLKKKYSSSLALIELSKHSYTSSISKEDMEKYQRDLHNSYRINGIISNCMNPSFTI
jgi:hypothetical protein